MPNDLRRLLAPLAITMSCVILAVLSCEDHGVVSPKPETPTLKYQDEAEEIALYTAGTLRPQDWLVRQVDRELQLIRSTWVDSVPEVNIRFTPPWVFSSVGVRADQWLYDQITAGTNEEWNRLVKDLSLRVVDHKWEFYPRCLSLLPTTKLHPIRVAEHFVGFPGLEYVEAGGNLQSWDNFFVRTTSAKGAKYYFKRCTCPDVLDAYAYFEVDGDSARFHGIHYECWDSIVVSPTWVSMERFQEIVDSLEVARPAWVDTVRTAVGLFSHGLWCHWYRSQ